MPLIGILWYQRSVRRTIFMSRLNAHFRQKSKKAFFGRHARENRLCQALRKIALFLAKS